MGHGRCSCNTLFYGFAICDLHCVYCAICNFVCFVQTICCELCEEGFVACDDWHFPQNVLSNRKKFVSYFKIHQKTCFGKVFLKTSFYPFWKYCLKIDEPNKLHIKLGLHPQSCCNFTMVNIYCPFWLCSYEITIICLGLLMYSQISETFPVIIWTAMNLRHESMTNTINVVATHSYYP